LIIPHSFPSINNNDYTDLEFLFRESFVGSKNNFNDLIVKEINKFIFPGETYVTQSGSQGLLIALKNMRVQEGDKVALCAINCPSVVNVLKFIGAVPVFYDVRGTSDFRPSKSDIETVLKEHSPKVAIITHCFGVLVEREIISYISDNYEIKVIEDYATSFPSVYSRNIKVGQHSDCVIGSFGSTKPISGGIGGFISLKNSRFTPQYDSAIDKNDKITFNINISSINQSLILNQLNRIDSILLKRKKIVEFYSKYLNVWQHSCDLFRAITFDDTGDLAKDLRSIGCELDVRSCLHPYVSSSDMENALNFNSYLSLPLNIKMYEYLVENKLL
jgi:dTDP-4-amino-4,6-dideoxygalactose transaminase